VGAGVTGLHDPGLDPTGGQEEKVIGGGVPHGGLPPTART
jgi:hypothetical protein